MQRKPNYNETNSTPRKGKALNLRVRGKQTWSEEEKRQKVETGRRAEEDRNEREERIRNRTRRERREVKNKTRKENGERDSRNQRKEERDRENA